MRLFRRYYCNRKWYEDRTCGKRLHHKCVRAVGHEGEHRCRCGVMR